MGYVRALILILLSAHPLIASPGKGEVLYEQYCGACHGTDGRGGGEGQIPPLADSNWVKGEPGRVIQIILFGLMGEIEVKSKHSSNSTYDLAMPPQGDVLTDDEIARIASYVRASWGNKEAAVTAAMVEKQRVASKGRTGFWRAGEILKKYPLKP